MILVDSSVWIDFFSRSPGPAGQELQRLITSAEPFALTGVVVTEVLQGVTRNSVEIENFLSGWTFLEPNGISTYREAAALFRLARARGVTVSTIDAVIAAIAFEYSASVFTLDRDFFHLARIGGFSLYSSVH